jgi:hypothetical protein
MDNALYFPFISVPETPWFTRVLLYWDRVGSIIPFEFLENPERLSPYTQSLLTEELLVQVRPGQYLGRLPRFRDAFVEYMESLPQAEIQRRRASFRGNSVARVHVEKMGGIARYLKDTQLAREVNWSWCDVEMKTAREFMAYLAALLGKLEDVRSTPITDRSTNLDPFLKTSQPDWKAEARLAPLRSIVLQRLLPAPERPVSLLQLRLFKDKHGELLRVFRQSVEQEIASIADMTDPDLQEHRLANFLAEKEETIQRVVAHLSEGGLGKIVFCKICAIVAAIPGVNAIFGLANAVYSALSSESPSPASGALLYAAYVEKELQSK